MTVGVVGRTTRRCKVQILGGRLGREWVRLAGRREGLRQVVAFHRRILAEWIEEQIGEAEERRLPIELQVILALQDVVEHSESAANTHLAVALGIPCEAEAGRPIVLIREVRTHGSLWIARE